MILREGKRQELDVLYKVIFDEVHDLEQSREFSFLNNTQKSFNRQWEQYPSGQYLLSDQWFKENLTRILSEEELLIDPAWFKGKTVLDAGCGNGRWSYGFCQLGAKVTSVDVNASAINSARDATNELDNRPSFINSSLESLNEVLTNEQYDLVFSWGVLHHCVSYNKALKNVCEKVGEGGVLYLHLYGRESMTIEEDLSLFKKRLLYNTLLSDQEKYQFLLNEANGDKNRVHNLHDNYAPLINRRLNYEDVERDLIDLGFSNVTRTIDHSELFVRAFKGSFSSEDALLASKDAPYWFQHHKN